MNILVASGVGDIGRHACKGVVLADRKVASGMGVDNGIHAYSLRMHPNDGGLVVELHRSSVAGQATTSCGDGTQARSFCYVDDLIEGLVRLMSSSDELFGRVN